MSLSLRELEILEEMQRETQLTNDDLLAAFNERMNNQTTSPLHRFTNERLLKFFRDIHDGINRSRELRRDLHADGDPTVQPLPSFDKWLGVALYRKLTFGN